MAVLRVKLPQKFDATVYFIVATLFDPLFATFLPLSDPLNTNFFDISSLYFIGIMGIDLIVFCARNSNRLLSNSYDLQNSGYIFLVYCISLVFEYYEND